MLSWLDKELPEGIEVTRPTGGMFLWITLPEGKSSVKLFNIAASKNVAFVPGIPFYINYKDINTLRMNFTNSSFENIERGIKLFAGSIKEIL
jgi:2-aminoadipate transaminase